MKKQVRKYGNSLVITFNQEEQKIYGIKEGSILDLDIGVDIPDHWENPMANKGELKSRGKDGEYN